MKRKNLAILFVPAIFTLFFWECGNEQVVDIAAVTSTPQKFVGSDTCKMCHLEHYDSWKMTLHSRMLQDAKANEDAIIVSIDETTIRSDLATLSDTLSVPANQIAVYWGMPLLAVTGLALMYPIFTSRFVPGWALNIAVLLHRAEAILAISYIFIVHF